MYMHECIYQKCSVSHKCITFAIFAIIFGTLTALWSLNKKKHKFPHNAAILMCGLRTGNVTMGVNNIYQALQLVGSNSVKPFSFNRYITELRRYLFSAQKISQEFGHDNSSGLCVIQQFYEMFSVKIDTTTSLRMGSISPL